MYHGILICPYLLVGLKIMVNGMHFFTKLMMWCDQKNKTEHLIKICFFLAFMPLEENIGSFLLIQNGTSSPFSKILRNAWNPEFVLHTITSTLNWIPFLCKKNCNLRSKIYINSNGKVKRELTFFVSRGANTKYVKHWTTRQL